MASKNLSPSKAKKMLHDKTVRGRKITARQRRYFAAVAGGKAR